MPEISLSLLALLGVTEIAGINIYYIVGGVIVVIVILFALNYSGSKVRSLVAEPWKTLADNTNTDLNLGFFLQTPIVSGKYRGIPMRAYSKGNVMIGTYRTCLETAMPQEVPWQVYLFGQHVSESYGTLMGLDDLSREIPDFTGQLLSKGLAEPIAIGLANPQLMQVLQGHPKGAIQVVGNTLTFETSTILTDPTVMIELMRWLHELSKYFVQLR